jgi:FkbM family methyltransferase
MKFPLKQQILRSIGHQHWLRGRDRILRAFDSPDNHESYPFEIDFFGKNYTGNLNNFIDWLVFYYGAFSVHELKLLGDLATALRARKEPVLFFDVGANIGHHSLFMSQYADQIFSFEPFSVVREEMKRKLAHAGVTNVTIFPVALGDKTEHGDFHPPTGANQGTGTLGSNLPDNASSETISVEVVRGDDFFAAHQLPQISLLKMDVEGYELKALEGLQKTLWRDRPPIFVEIQPGRNGLSVIDLFYPDHLLFKVEASRGTYRLTPFIHGNTEEALVLPAELAGIVPGTHRN